MAYDKPELDVVWADGGAVVEPSDTKKQQGWVAEVPPHQYENWVQRRQDEFIFHVNERGIAEWDGNTNYLGDGRSLVQGVNGTIYKSVSASGPAGIVSDPTQDSANTYWEKAFADNSDSRIENAVPNTRQIIAGTGLDGGGNLSANRTLNVRYGASAGTAAQGNDSRIVNAVPNGREIIAGNGLSGGGDLSTNRTLSVDFGTTVGTAAQGNDARLSNSREWTASTVSQSEAEAGQAATRKAWTAQRVRQAIVAWWDTMAGTGSSQFRTNSQNDSRYALASRSITAGTGLQGGGSLTTSRTLSVSYGTTAGTAAQGNDSRLSDSREWTASTVSQSEAQAGESTTRRAWTAQRVRQAVAAWWGTMAGTGGSQFRTNSQNDSRFAQQSGTYSGLRAQATTASDVGAPPTSRTITAGDGLSGGGNLSSNRTLSVDSSVVRTSRTITAGTGLTGGGSLSSNRTISLGNHSANLLTSGTVSIERIPIGLGDGGIASYTTTSNSSNTNYAVGTYVVAKRDGYDQLPQRSDGRSVYLSSTNSEFTLDASAGGASLPGVWHSRGRLATGTASSGDQGFLMQRIG